MKADDDQALMLRFQQHGDSQAFARLFERHKDGLLRFLLRLTASPVQAEEVSQIVWIKLLEAAEHGTYRASATAQFRTWLFTLARNAWLDLERRGARLEFRGEVPEPEVEDGAPQERALEQAQIDQALERAIQALPVEQREVIALWADGVPYRDIARIQRVAVDTVIGRKRYAVAHLRAQLDAAGIRWSDA